jgi:hypothetical protein
MRCPPYKFYEARKILLMYEIWKRLTTRFQSVSVKFLRGNHNTKSVVYFK